MADTEQANCIIETENLSKIYEVSGSKVVAIDNIDLKVMSGEFVAIVGPSGSGKSTLLHLLGLLDYPTAGHYRLQGKETLDLTDSECSRIRGGSIGFVFQQFSLIAELTVLENVALPLTYSAEFDRGCFNERAISVLEQVGLGRRLEHKPASISGGEMQRVAIARSLVRQPAILLADEPTGNLDKKNGESVVEILMELNSLGTTQIIVTHNESVAKHCHRVLTMVDGMLHE